jgi:hypothetical protein
MTNQSLTENSQISPYQKKGAVWKAPLLGPLSSGRTASHRELGL